ncbi:MAG: hypothetical protein R2844_13600 [Caldilineales bacterium]
MTRYATIIGTGRYVPETIQTNDMLQQQVSAVNPDLAAVVDRFEESSGIVAAGWRRAIGLRRTSPCAAEDALHAAGIRPDQVDMILLGTDTPDYITPATSTVVQHKLGAVNAGTYDIGCACASFPTGIATAAGLLATNPWMNYVLVVGVYMMSKLADPADVTSFFYSDGAGAVVIATDSKPGFISSAYLADGAYHDYWGLYAGATDEPASVQAVEAGRTNVRLLQRYPPDVNHENWPRIVRLLAERRRACRARHRPGHLHPGAPVVHQACDGGPGPAAGEDALGDG